MKPLVIIFSGPSLKAQDRAEFSQFRFKPPAGCGDILRCLHRDKPSHIGLIDGYFEDQPSVHHKELLETMAAGVRLYGASSMGALRACELQTYGMIGVGKIFQNYNNGTLTSDADVAVSHSPEALDYRPLSLPQVDVISTVQSLKSRGHLTATEANGIIRVSAEIFYKKRDWPTIGRAVERSEEAARRLTALLDRSHVQAKRLDALDLLNQISNDLRNDLRPGSTAFMPPLTPAYSRLRTSVLSKLSDG